MLGPVMATNEMTTTSIGNDMTMSVKRMRSISTAPPKKPERLPITIPIAVEIETATMPTDSDTRPP